MRRNPSLATLSKCLINDFLKGNHMNYLNKKHLKTKKIKEIFIKQIILDLAL